MNAFTFWQRWLVAVGVILIIFGLALAFFNQSALFDFLFNNQINPVFWTGDSMDISAASFQRWVYGVLGATIAGWGVMVLFIVAVPFRQKESWAWICLAVGVGLWYLVDTYLSLSAGATFNAIFNTLLLALVVLPLAFTHSYFFGKG